MDDIWLSREIGVNSTRTQESKERMTLINVTDLYEILTDIDPLAADELAETNSEYFLALEEYEGDMGIQGL
eukprot:5395122-Prymnesium_polylepis.1